MKKYLLRIITLLIFASAISGCSVEYRNAHRRHDGGDYGHDHGNEQH